MTSFLSVYSQEKTFRYFGGGSLGFNYSKTDAGGGLGIYSDNSSTTFSGSPTVAYFIKENLTVGLALEYSINNTNYTKGILGII